MSQPKKLKITQQDLYVIKENASKTWTKIVGEEPVPKAYVIAVLQFLKNSGLEVEAEFVDRKLPLDYTTEDC